MKEDNDGPKQVNAKGLRLHPHKSGTGSCTARSEIHSRMTLAGLQKGRRGGGSHPADLRRQGGRLYLCRKKKRNATDGAGTARTGRPNVAGGGSVTAESTRTVQIAAAGSINPAPPFVDSSSIGRLVRANPEIRCRKRRDKVSAYKTRQREAHRETRRTQLREYREHQVEKTYAAAGARSCEQM